MAFVIEIARFDGNGCTDRLARHVLAFGYFFLCFAFLAPHRLMAGDNALGMFAIVLLISTVKMSDAAAYFVGKSMGTLKLAPRLSPGKTWQGVGGAVLGGLAAVALMIYVVGPLAFGIKLDKPIAWMMAYALAVTIAGIIGDLAESLLKRDSHCKDSSRWLPGLGGILDLIDSLVFAAPISYLVWIFPV
jgi:phosphatidate cytidylyltransferase